MTPLSLGALRRDFVFVTGSADKLREAERVLGFAPAALKLDLPEPQGLDLRTILAAKAEAAFARAGRPVVVEDVSFEMAALGGFPGPLVKWMLASLVPERFAGVALALGDARAEAICGLAYYDGAGPALVFEGRTAGTLVAEARGSHGFGWDPVFRPEGSALTCAEQEPAEKDRHSHRGKAWRALLAALDDSL